MFQLEESNNPAEILMAFIPLYSTWENETKQRTPVQVIQLQSDLQEVVKETKSKTTPPSKRTNKT
jgi:hypothetical protein